MLTIAIVTYISLGASAARTDNIMIFLERNIAFILGGIWSWGLFTGLVNFAWAGYGKTGNWCWIFNSDAVKRTTARYVLTHGPRIAIFLTIIFLYLHLILYLRAETRKASRTLNSVQFESNSNSALEGTSQLGDKMWNSGEESMTGKEYNIKAAQRDRQEQARQRKLRDAIIRLVAFPSSYVCLWIPGMVNRIFDAMGQVNATANLFQAITQYLGFAHAIICLWNLRVVILNRKRSVNV